ncbi:MAG: 5'-nucleotidase C-terminal domain-containing protein, partial [Candidatus Competibacteraceae bacterium]|nr:5'-nucleotidase C-terminal domain-containing protein [Candidatus Competibacteraceae bacterium]
FRQQGFEPEKVIATTTAPLDGLESSVRSTQTNLTQLIAASMLAAYSDVDLSLYNSGSIRIDDSLPPGKITVYDVIRILPFGGQVQLATIKGSLLIKALDQGLANKNTGGFLQSANTQWQNGVWLVNGKPIDAAKTYRLAINDFLASGRERGLDFLKPGNPDFTIVQSGEGLAYDMRQLLIGVLGDAK